MASHLDPTLLQVLSELYEVSRERDQYRAVLAKVNEKLDDEGYLLGRLNEVRAGAGSPPATLPADEAPDEAPDEAAASGS